METDFRHGKIETFPVHGDKIVILTPKQIIAGVDPSVVDKWIENIEIHQSISGKFDEVIVIDIPSVEEIETKQKGRLIGVTYQEGEEQTYEPLIMKDEHTKEAFLDSLNCYLDQDDYTHTTEKYSPLKAMVSPLAVLGVVLVAGTFFYWFANLIQTQGGPHRPVRVKVYVAVFYYILTFIGPTGALAITVLASLACAVWMIKRMKTPPVKIVIAKKQ